MSELENTLKPGAKDSLPVGKKAYIKPAIEEGTALPDVAALTPIIVPGPLAQLGG